MQLQSPGNTLQPSSAALRPEMSAALRPEMSAALRPEMSAAGLELNPFNHSNCRTSAIGAAVAVVGNFCPN